MGFLSDDGKNKFVMLMKAMERKEKRRDYDRARRARLREMRNSNVSIEGAVNGVLTRTVSCSSRQRVRLVFGTENGRATFAGAVRRNRKEVSHEALVVQ
jgi:hypothetical protein